MNRERKEQTGVDLDITKQAGDRMWEDKYSLAYLEGTSSVSQREILIVTEMGEMTSSNEDHQRPEHLLISAADTAIQLISNSPA